MDYIFKSIYFDFPDRAERKTVIGDCTPLRGMAECPGHPGGAHSEGRAIDTSYYIYQGGNVSTSLNLPIGWKRISIWMNPDSPTSRIKEDVFDWDRTWIMVKRVRRFLSGITLMDKRVKTYIADKVREKYGYDEYRLVMTTIGGDDPMKCGHHRHIHFFVNNFLR